MLDCNALSGKSNGISLFNRLVDVYSEARLPYGIGYPGVTYKFIGIMIYAVAFLFLVGTNYAKAYGRVIIIDEGFVSFIALFLENNGKRATFFKLFTN